MTGAKVEADAQMTSMDMGTTPPAFREPDGGRYQGAVAFSMPGSWRVTLHITPPDGGPVVTKTLDYAVRR